MPGKAAGSVVKRAIILRIFEHYKPKIKQPMIRIMLALTVMLFALGSHAQTAPASASATAPVSTTMTAAQVFEKYYAALGGKDKLLTVTDITTEMSTEVQGNAMIMTRLQKLPNKSMMSMNAMGMVVFKMTTDGAKVQRGGMQGNTAIEGDEAKRTIANGTIFPELHYAENGITSQVDGIEKVDGKDAYKVVNTLGTLTWSDFYDVASGLKTQSVASTKTPQGERTQTSTFADFKPTNGILFPMTINQQSPRGPMTLTIDAVRINKGLKDSEFTVKE
jgi:hypothetical protein